MPGWTVADSPPLTGKIAVVTGSNGGLGFETALALARRGAQVVIAARNEEKGLAAVAAIGKAAPSAIVRHEALDLANLASMSAFAHRISDSHPALDLLINNAGIMLVPRRQTTADGFEMQFGTNYLGHFALTAHLLPMLRRVTAPRVVSLSSIAHKTGAIRFNDLQSERGYSPWAAYSQSKLAMLMFALELQRRSDAAGWTIASLAAHPGWSRTDLFTNGPGATSLLTIAGRFAAPLLSQSAAEGALPILYAATSPDAKGGSYWGPAGLSELTGPPGKARMAIQARDSATAAKLWVTSEALTGVSFAS
jgi:NAD(P)-dependent dehydrogenase (short-subunit alcohol dehydrogenase family)